GSSGQSARWRRTASASAAERAPSTNAGASSAASEQVRPAKVCSATAASSPAVEREQRSAKSLQPEAQAALDRAQRNAGSLRDLDLGQATEIGELDRLTLDVRDPGHGEPDRLAVEPQLDITPGVGQGQR